MGNHFNKGPVLFAIGVILAWTAFAQSQSHHVPQDMTLAEYVSVQKQLIEDGYRMRLTALQDDAQIRARRLSTVEKALWTEYFRMIQEEIGPDEYYRDIIANTTYTPYAISRPGRLRKELIGSYFADRAAQLMLDERAYADVLAITADTNVRKDSLLWKNAFAVQQIMQPLQIAQGAVEARRADQLRQLRQFAAQYDQRADRRSDQIQTEPQESGAERYVVSAVVPGKESIAMIGSEIVRPGQTLDGVKIVRIEPKSVVFERNGSVWSQKVGELPPG